MPSLSVPSMQDLINEMARFPTLRRMGESEFVRSIIFCTRLIPKINSLLPANFRADWGVIPYLYRGVNGLQEVDIGIYETDEGRIRVWNGNRQCNIRVALLEPPNTKCIIECKKDISLDKRFWNRSNKKSIHKFCARLASLNIPLWLIGETCLETDLRGVQTKGREVGFERVYVFSSYDEKGDYSFQKAKWDAFFAGVSRLR